MTLFQDEVRWRGFASRLALLLAGMLIGSACKGKATSGPDPSASASAARHVDELAPGELAEGTDKAFDLPIPRRMRIDATFPDAVFARGPVAAEHVANYVRERVVAERVETGPAKTVFTKAKLKGQEAAPRVLRIEVVRREATTELVVRDQTPPPVEPGLTPEERMRKKGLLPDGTPIDKTRLQ